MASDIIIPASVDELIEILRRRRQEQHLSQLAVATRVGLSNNGVRFIDVGVTRNPDVRTIDSYANGLGLNGYYLINGKKLDPQCRGPPTIAATLRKKREERELTTREVEQLTRGIVGNNNVSAYERGKHSPGLKALYALGTAYDLHPVLFSENS